jgi:peptidoglycan/LPS O-acetylase OafA/YrhL
MKQYWKSLDGLRAIAVGIVMLAHAGSPYPRSGGVGVDIFFVLSGFLITGILSSEFERYGSISRKYFYVRRLLRLTPCLVSCVLLFAVMSFILYGSVDYGAVLISLTYTSNYARALFDYDLQSLGHCWSLAIEEQYYLIWPFVIILVERKLKRNITKFLLLMIIALCLGIYRSSMVGTFSAERIYFSLDTHMDGLVMGSSLAYLVRVLSGVQMSAALRLLMKVVSRVIVPVGIVGTLVMMYFITWSSPWMGRLGFTFVAIVAGVTILDLVVSPFSLFRGLLENGVLGYIGKISYGLYLYHVPVYHVVKSELSGVGVVWRILMMIAVSFATASISYHLLEKRFLLLKKQFGHGDRTDRESIGAVQLTKGGAAPDL